MNMTLDIVRAEIAEMIGEPADYVTDDDSLIDLGLDSMRAMMLVQRWSERGVELSFAELAEQPTLAAWWALIARRQAGA